MVPRGDTGRFPFRLRIWTPTAISADGAGASIKSDVIILHTLYFVNSRTHAAVVVPDWQSGRRGRSVARDTDFTSRRSRRRSPPVDVETEGRLCGGADDDSSDLAPPPIEERSNEARARFCDLVDPGRPPTRRRGPGPPCPPDPVPTRKRLESSNPMDQGRKSARSDFRRIPTQRTRRPTTSRLPRQALDAARDSSRQR